MLVPDDRPLAASRDNEGIAYLGQGLHSSSLRSHGAQIVGRLSLADVQRWHCYGLPCRRVRSLFPWQGGRRQALHHHLDGFLNTRKDGALVQEFYFGFAGVDIYIQEGGRQGDPQRRHRMAPRGQERAVRSLQGSAYQGTPHWPTIHPAILPLPCGTMDRWRTYGSLDTQIQTLPGDWQHLRRQFLAKDNGQALSQVSSGWGKQQPPALMLHMQCDLRMRQRIVGH